MEKNSSFIHGRIQKELKKKGKGMNISLDFDQYIKKLNSITIIGLGYVGLPLAVLFAKKFKVIGFDINEKRVKELTENYDATNEITSEELKDSTLEFTTDPKVISDAKLIIVTVPTPVDDFKTPDLTPVRRATETVANHLTAGSVVVYESTVYPGVTEDVCVPILEQLSGLKWKVDFHVGYSPERVNPGDKEHTIDKIKKVVSGDTPEICEELAKIYGEVITAGIHKASTIKVAESAKVIENVQRDVNIALVNELSLIFHKLDIDTKEVLEAAGSKWNFLPFMPGLVGGHCIGVDPYYLTFKAESIGHHPQLILSGRRINDYMGKFIAESTVKKLIEADKNVKGCKVLILGFTFKENINDIRNTRVIDIYHELISYGMNVELFDPHIDQEEVKHEYGIYIQNKFGNDQYDAIIFAVKHDILVKDYSIKRLKEISTDSKLVLIDVKSIFNRTDVDDDVIFWRL
jgi:UDP-N-acetyl-D-galactosamine dehydrogenase